MCNRNVRFAPDTRTFDSLCGKSEKGHKATFKN